MSNELAQQPKFSAMISTPAYKKLINRTIEDPARARRFVTAITSAVAVNPALQECTPHTILSAALLGESLNLSPSPQLGHYYMVPRENKKNNGIKDATFQLGYKGYIQLALRSGYYKRINVINIKGGELVRWNPLTEECQLDFIYDENVRESTQTIGYLAFFEYLNGFKKTIYWTKEKMITHADRYSPAFSRDATKGKYPKVSFADYEAHNYPASDEWKYSSYWYKDFDGMAYKTMLRQLISKWGIMSIELQSAFENDESVLEATEDGDFIQVEESEPVVVQEASEDAGDKRQEKEEKRVSLSDIQ